MTECLHVPNIIEIIIIIDDNYDSDLDIEDDMDETFDYVNSF